MDISCLKDLDRVAQEVGLPVGSRIGRSKEKREWFVLLGFLRPIIASGGIDLPILIHNGKPPDEPDFVMVRAGSTVGLFEVTEATDEADQKEMTAFERSNMTAALLGEFGGRFADGASRPGLTWAEDILDAIKRKSGKAIFRDSLVPARHLLVYPNSNASFLLADEQDEREAINNLRVAIAEDKGNLSHITNGCLVHVLGKHVLCCDALGDMKVLTVIV